MIVLTPDTFIQQNTHLIIGSVAILVGVINIAVIYLRKNWLEAAAEILVCRATPVEAAEIKAHTSIGFTSVRRSKSLKLHTTYKPSLLYKYIVDGKVYLGQNMYSGPLSWLDSGIIRFFNEGSHYPVRYNPKNPEASYLMFSGWVVYAVLVIVGVGIIKYQPIMEFLNSRQ